MVTTSVLGFPWDRLGDPTLDSREVPSMAAPKGLTLQMTSESGTGELEVDLDHPLVGAFRKAIETGKPPGRWLFFMVEDQPDLAPIVVGTFVYTPGDRFLFFPGSSTVLAADHSEAPFAGKRLEHLTLDPPGKPGKHSSHVAVAGSPHKQSRGIRYTTTPPSDFMVPWFSLVVSNLRGFHRLPRQLHIHFPPPRPDVTRFGEQLLAAGGSTSVPLPPPAGNPNYLQFDIWAGRGVHWREAREKPLSWPYKPELVANAPESEQRVTVRRGQIDFSATAGLVLNITRPAGQLRGSRILRPNLTETNPTNPSP